MKIDIPEKLNSVVKAGIKAQRAVPGSVALGGSVCAIFVNHRASADIDFVLADLSQRFQEVRDHLFELPDWKEARVSVPVLILGSMDEIEIGYRQLRRSVPLETQEIETPDGTLVVPTVPELIRTKAFLVYDRNYTRDYFDLAELSFLLETDEVVDILSDLDERFQWEKQPTIVVEVIKKLISPNPHDLYDGKHGFEQLQFIAPRLKTWEEVAARCREIGERLSVRVLAK